jgi:hypothetical protein
MTYNNDDFYVAYINTGSTVNSKFILLSAFYNGQTGLLIYLLPASYLCHTSIEVFKMVLPLMSSGFIFLRYMWHVVSKAGMIPLH